MKQITELRGSGLVTDIEARNMIKKMVLSEEASKLTGEIQQDDSTGSDMENDTVLDGLYEED